MSLIPNTPGFRPAQVPTYRFDETRARDAYEAHIALLDQERRFPKLRDNPAWTVLRADAYENFALAFGGEA
jgi:hypothetical protein